MKDHLKQYAFDSIIVDHTLEKYGKPTSLSDGDRRTLITEYRKASGAYARSVLDHDATVNGYVLEANVEAPAHRVAVSAASGTTLGPVALRSRYWL